MARVPLKFNGPTFRSTAHRMLNCIYYHLPIATSQNILNNLDWNFSSINFQSMGAVHNESSTTNRSTRSKNR